MNLQNILLRNQLLKIIDYLFPFTQKSRVRKSIRDRKQISGGLKMEDGGRKAGNWRIKKIIKILFCISLCTVCVCTYIHSYTYKIIAVAHTYICSENIQLTLYMIKIKDKSITLQLLPPTLRLLPSPKIVFYVYFESVYVYM